MSNGNLPLRTRDEGPALREEKHYTDLYPDLDHHELLPILMNENKDRLKSEHNESEATEERNQIIHNKLPHVKQIIFNNKVTIEPLGPQLKKSLVRFCKVTVPQLSGNYRVSKQYQKYGYRTGQSLFDKGAKYLPYMKRTDHLIENENDYFASISPALRDFRVEYDMDEQDDLYLKFLNETRLKGSKKQLDYEIFEIVMTVLEVEWFSLEKKIPQRPSTALTSNTHEFQAAKAHYELYGSDDGTGYANDQPCAVCGGTDSDNTNAIVFCDGCDVAVHQECYGVVFIPEGQWLCRRCMISKRSKINCLFCPSNTGAFKQTDTGSWGHVICGIWIPELIFANLHYMEPIEGIDLVPKSRWRLNCYICKQKNGACIQCANKNCFTAFHVTCAKRAGLYMDFGGCTVLEAASKNFRQGTKLESFCDKHSPVGWGNCELGIMKTRAYFQNIAEMKVQESQREQQPHNDNEIRNRWKTNRSTPIAPHLFLDTVKQVLDTIGISQSEKIAIDMCKYWSMKRELKRGAPLVRKFDPSSFNTLSTSELEERAQFVDILLKDINKLEDIASLIVQRQTAAMLKDEANEIIDNIAFHPVRYILRNNLRHLWDTRDFKIIKEYDGGFSNVLERIENDNYKSIAEFLKDIRSIMNNLSAQKDIPAQVRKSLTIFERQFNKKSAKIEDLDIHKLLSRDFRIERDRIEEVEWMGPILMEEEGLSDVEVEELTPAQERILKSFLR
ncbi:HEL036Cp [Eremothecium sinecaudum]|uniref:HEL036Cp n=1 Tax=Eremothecium sinecaudum TaxID=45286 RepID=A0A0X8HTN1_9SACH|nr:HEL036Cp [Eremothecium sinecaudum]AMD21244.1 HEL036Cp [Eremothecium sinecaudum]